MAEYNPMWLLHSLRGRQTCLKCEGRGSVVRFCPWPVGVSCGACEGRGWLKPKPPKPHEGGYRDAYEDEGS